MIQSHEQLRQLYSEPAERALLKQQLELDRYCLRFIALSPFVVMATGGANGSLLDASPRGGKPGFVKAPDAQTLLIPDAGGNNRLDSLSNLIIDILIQSPRAKRRSDVIICSLVKDVMRISVVSIEPLVARISLGWLIGLPVSLGTAANHFGLFGESDCLNSGEDAGDSILPHCSHLEVPL